jgi:hypothetical protein
MSYENDSYVLFFVESAEKVDDLATGAGIEIACRFVRHQDGWVVDERACDRDTLLLASRKLAGVVV